MDAYIVQVWPAWLADLPLCVDAMHLEDVLGDIDPDCANLHVDGPLM